MEAYTSDLDFPKRVTNNIMKIWPLGPLGTAGVSVTDGRKARKYVRIRIVIQGDESSTEIFDGVMICTGHHVYPHIPYIDGIEDFRGTKLHSHDYKTPEPFTNKRVLIVGKCCIKSIYISYESVSLLVS